MKRLVLVIMVIGLLQGGCATEMFTDRHLPQITNDEYATVNIVRELRFVGGSITIQFDGKDLLRIGNGDCISFKIPTGQSEIALSSTTQLVSTANRTTMQNIFDNNAEHWAMQTIRKRVEFIAEKGKNYYFYVRADAGTSGDEFRQLTNDEYADKSKSCNWIKLEDKPK